ncbi:hypothetical protein L596_019216 [Steinernema carpocapsae]|uniref:G-protein coupled receptors family 1 profile domain-containing protein n=1 Tax=Steinernema carpocapsae TaxID=34508 RepID=A0A4U5MPT2_STECR|nr:hypothetical protein L596_019216 [Steinernema carpocapsae]
MSETFPDIPLGLIIFAGTLYIVLAVVLLTLNLLVLVTILRFKEFSTVTYRIIKNMCVACIIQQVIFFISGFMTLSSSSFNETFEKIIGSLIQACWLLYLSLSLTLAIDRMLTFVCSHLGDRVSFVLLGLSYLHAFIHFVTLLLPYLGFNYCVPDSCFGWYYDFDKPTSKAMEAVEPWILLVLEVGIFVCYLVVLGALIKLRSGASENYQTFRTELKILTVAVVSFLYEASLIIFLYWGINWMVWNNDLYITATVLWMLDSGVFPLATLAINTTQYRR